MPIVVAADDEGGSPGAGARQVDFDTWLGEHTDFEIECRIAFRWMEQLADAEEVVGTALTKVLAYQQSEQSLRTGGEWQRYVVGAMANAAIDIWRKRQAPTKGVPEAVGDLVEAERRGARALSSGAIGVDPLDLLVAVDTQRRVAEAVSGLSPILKEVIEATLDGGTQSQLAARLGLTLEVFKSRRAQAYVKLRERLEPLWRYWEEP